MDKELSATLSEFVGSMVNEASVEDILDRFARRLVELLPVTGAGVTLIGSGQTAGYVTASSPSAMAAEKLQSQLLDGPCLAALESSEVCSVSDLRTEDRFERYVPAAREAGFGAVFAFPLRAQGSPLGAVDLYREHPGELSAEELSATQVLADAVASLVVNARERRDREASMTHLQNVAHRDPLTGLPNRVLLQERLEQATRRRARSQLTFAVIFLDLDAFKSVNDQHGHGVGDELLIEISRRLQAVLRPADTLARFGGDEFVILCEDLDPAEIKLVAARVTAQFAAPFSLSRITVPMRASIGIASPNEGCESPEALLHAADQAMYEHKRAPNRDQADAPGTHPAERSGQ